MKNAGRNSQTETINGKKSGKMVKAFQILSVVFMLAMLIICIIMLKRYNIKVSNLDEIQGRITGGLLTIGVGMILFSVIKSFALVFPPAVLFALSGLLIDNVWIAICINLAATVLSLSLPYFMGRFTGKSMVTYLKEKFPKIQKIDTFMDKNDFSFVFILKVSGILPSDLSSLLFGAMEIDYKSYMAGAILGLMPLNVLWTCLGAFGDLHNPLSALWILPIIVFSVICALLISRKNKQSLKEGEKGS